MIIRQFAFHDRVPSNPPDILQGMSEREFLEKCYNRDNLNASDLLSYGIYRLSGWEFKFDTLNKYLVKRYNDWNEYYAPNKTLLRKAMYARNQIQRIILLDKGKEYE
jgi:hypothetical protein